MSLSGVRGLNLFRDVILSEGSWFGCLVLFFHSSMLLSVLMSCNKGAQDFPPSCMVLFCSGFLAAGSGFKRGVGTVRGRRSDELDFLLRQVEQAFTPRSSLRMKL